MASATSTTPRGDAIAGLSFVGMRTQRLPGQSPRGFWVVQASGDYERDCALGSRLALEYLAVAELFARSSILQWIVRDMPAKQTGVEVGFLSTLGTALAYSFEGRIAAEQRVARWEELRKTIPEGSANG
jgi:hypothetical protein